MTDIYIHPSAQINPLSKIGSGSRIWSWVQIRENSQIGENVTLSKGVYIDCNVCVGNNVKIQNNVSLFNGVVVDDGVFIGPHVCFTNDLQPRAISPEGSLKRENDWVVTPTTISHGASIGANSTILCGITIGKWAMIGSGSVVTKDVPDYGLVVGNPARLLGYVCPCGKRATKSGFNEFFCDKCKKSFDL